MAIGIRNGDLYLGTRNYPDRKNPTLVYEEGNKATVLGTVRDEETFEEALQKILQAKAEEV